MLNGKAIKIAGLAVTLAGFGLNLISGWVDNKILNEAIAEKVAEAIADQK